MASNALPNTLERLLALTSRLCNGLHQFEASVGVKQITETVLRAAHDAARDTELAFGESLRARKAAYAALAVADESGRTFLSNARKRLAKFFGESCSVDWSATGWPSGTTGVPRTQDDRYVLIDMLGHYFTSHPEHASVDMETTVAIAQSTFTALSEARAMVDRSITASGDAKLARDAAEARLRKRAFGLINELAQVLDGDDSRWLSFGLNRPDDEETPEPPEAPTVTPSATPGMLLVSWEPARRAAHYRVWKQVTGTDEDFVAVESPRDNNAILTDLPSDALVKVCITAVNSVGESRASPEEAARVT